MPADLTVRIDGAPVPVYLGENTSEAARYAGIAQDAATASAASANYYSTIAAGVAATPVGGAFSSNDGGSLKLYERTGTSPFYTEIGELDGQLRADLASTATGKGAALVGAIQAGTGAVARTIQDKLRDNLHVSDFLTADEISDIQAGTLLIDVTAKLQNAINAAVSRKARLHFIAGKYKTSAPLICGPWTGSAWSGFATFAVKGPTRSYGGSLGAAIHCSDVNAPAVIIQNGRGIEWEGVAVMGPNAIESSISANYSLMGSLSNFDTGTCRTSRYSPQAGFCIDPFGTSVPADGGYPGLTAYYATGAAGSSNIRIAALIYENIVGIMVTPNQVTKNAENIDLTGCRVSYNKYGVAIGQSQSRNVTAQGISTTFNGICFDGLTFGRQQGVCPQLYGANVAGRWAFNFSPSYGTAPVIVGLHAESLFSLGSFYGPASYNDPVVFVQPRIKFADFSTGGLTKVYPDAHLLTSCQIQFIGGNIDTNELDGIVRFYVSGAVGFSKTSIRAKYNEFPIARSAFTASLQSDGLKFDDAYLMGDVTRGVSTGKSLMTDNFVGYSLSQIAYCPAPCGAQLRLQDSAANSRRIYWNAAAVAADTYRQISATQSLTVGSDGVGTMTVPDGTLVRVGDVIVSVTSWTPEGGDASTWNPIGIVSVVSGNDVTLVGVPQNFTSGTYNLYNTWWNRWHLQSAGDVTSGSSSIVNVTNPTTWKVGHRIRGSGIPLGAYVTAVSGSTVTISKNATATNQAVRLYDADPYYAAGTAL